MSLIWHRRVLSAMLQQHEKECAGNKSLSQWRIPASFSPTHYKCRIISHPEAVKPR
jgi:hypothetical protein